ncbi:histidine kinase [Flavobacterium sp. GNP002]
MKVSTEIRKLTASIQQEYKLSDYEALTIALKIEENELFRKANVISKDDKYPSALEKIAIELKNKI